MALTRVNAPNHMRGLRNAESAIDLNSFRQRTNNPKEYIRNSDGGRIGFFHGFDAEAAITIEGNITTATADLVMAAAFGAALTIANDYDGYGVTAGTWTLEDIETSESKGALASATLNAIRLPGLTIA